MRSIEDYFLVGDLQTAALVAKGGSIDWLCLPFFDSPSIFAKILDKSGGMFSLDMPDYSAQSHYLPDTAIVEHKLSNNKSSIAVRDFMVPKPTKYCKTQLLVRKIIGNKGDAKVHIIFDPRLAYAKSNPEIAREETRLYFPLNYGKAILYYPSGTIISSGEEGINLELGIKKGEEKKIILEYVKKGELPINPTRAFETETTNFWRKWVKQGKFIQFCRENMVRSAINLKMMQFYPTGGIIAAPTTSLPEVIGGERNWDYRYVWVRDATFILYSLYILGYTEEAEQFFSFIENVTEHDRRAKKDIHLMYTIHGDPVPDEVELDHLTGYRNSQPVRVGNGATKQFQLDTYGALIDAYYFLTKRGMQLTDSNRTMIRYLLGQIEKNWQTKDNGIWEVRGGKQHFTYSKVMAWLGLNRALRLKDKLAITEKKAEKISGLERQIIDWIWENTYVKQEALLQQHPNTQHTDATNFLFVLLQFLDKHDKRTKKIIRRTAEELVYKSVFVYRYRTKDGLEGEEGAFILCTFWLISALAILEEVEEAKKLFNKFETYINRQGLISEEVDPDSGDYLGNYPQAFSHLGYIMSAYYIDKYERKVKSKK